MCLLALTSFTPVLAAPKPSHTALEQVSPIAPVKDALGNWVDGWEVVAKFSATADEKGVITTKETHEDEYTASATAHLAATAREKRNKLLADTDWVVTRAKELGQAVPSNVYNYRGDLRQVPEQRGFPETITWPEEI